MPTNEPLKSSSLMLSLKINIEIIVSFFAGKYTHVSKYYANYKFTEKYS